jgi:hypothetical protein
MSRRAATRTVTGREPWRSAAQTLLDEAGAWWQPFKSYRGRADWATDGVTKLIGCPEPRGRASFALFAHEVGHLVLHLREGRRGPHWLEEVEVWEFALDAFTRFELPGRDKEHEAIVRHVAWVVNMALWEGVEPRRHQARAPGLGRGDPGEPARLVEQASPVSAPAGEDALHGRLQARDPRHGRAPRVISTLSGVALRAIEAGELAGRLEPFSDTGVRAA